MCAGPHIDDLVWGNIQILTTQQGNLLVVIASSSLANAQHCIDSIAFKAGVLFFKLVEKGFCPVIKAPNMLGNCFYEHEWMSTFCICVCFHLSLYLCLFLSVFGYLSLWQELLYCLKLENILWGGAAMSKAGLGSLHIVHYKVSNVGATSYDQWRGWELV